MEENKKTVKEKLGSFVKEYSKGKFIGSIVMASISFVALIAAFLTFSMVLSVFSEQNALGVFFLLLIAIGPFALAELISLIFSIIGLSLATFNFKAVKNGKSITMFIITLVELVIAIALLIFLFIL